MHQTPTPVDPHGSRSPGWSLAIDFGTSNTAAAHTNPVTGHVETLALQHRGSTIPSAVYVESPGQIEVADVAANKAESNPAGFLPSPKRAIPHGEVTVNGYDLPAAAPVAAVLNAVVRRALAAHNGVPPARLVLTHPEDWSPREIDVLRQAAARLDLPATAVETVAEPRAAAHYYSKSHTVAPGSRIAVFDFGGGTLDIAVLHASSEGHFDVVTARGDNSLGGKNFDAALRRWLDDQIDNRDPDLLTYIRTTAPIHERLALDESIRAAKELLSEAPSATVSVPSPDGPERFHITREEFDEIIDPALDRALTLTRSVLSGVEDIDALYLTGGSSRIPLVHERLQQIAQVATLDDPKTVVSQGALTASSTAASTSAQPTASPATLELPTTAPLTDPATVRFQPVTAPHPDTGAPATDPQEPRETTTRTAGKRRAGPALAAAAVLAVVAVGVGGYTLWPQEDQAELDPAASPSSAALQNADTTGDEPTAVPAAGNSIVDSEEVALAALPTPLRSAIDSCEPDGRTDSGALEVSCQLSPDSPLTDGLSRANSVHIAFAIDPAKASRELINIRKRTYEDFAVATNEIIENPARTAAAHISGDENSWFHSRYANEVTSLSLTTYGTDSLDATRQLLTRAGLLN